MPAPASGHKRRRRPPASEITPDTPIWCPSCRAEHPAAAFTKESRRFSGLATICREAKAAARRTPEAQAAARLRNKQKWTNPAYREKSRENQRRRRQRLGATADLQRARRRLQLIVDEWKRQGCLDCGYSDIRAIDPDHLDGSKKAGHVSGWSSCVHRPLASETSSLSAFRDVPGAIDGSPSDSDRAHGERLTSCHPPGAVA